MKLAGEEKTLVTILVINISSETEGETKTNKNVFQ